MEPHSEYEQGCLLQILSFWHTHLFVWMPVISGNVSSRSRFSDSSKKQIPFQFTASIKWFLGKLGPENAEKPPYQCYVHLPLLNLHLSMTLRLRVLPENLVTSKNLEKSKGHWKRAKSTSCSFTAWRERRSCVYGACSRKREPVFLSEFWFAWSRVNQEQVCSRRLLAAPCCKWCQRYLRKFTLGSLRAQSFTQLRLPVGMCL